MDIEKMLTTEALRKKKPDMSVFDLVSFAIHRAQDMIVKGRDGYVKTESQSRATQILAEIANGKEFLDEFEDEDEDEQEDRYDSYKYQEFTDIKAVNTNSVEENKEPIA